MSVAIAARAYSTNWLAGTTRRRLIILAALAVVLSLVLARLVLAIDIGAVAALPGLVAVIAIAARPRYGVYLLFASALAFDAGVDDPLMVPGHYLNWSLQQTLHLSGAILTPFEILVLLTAAAWICHAAVHRRLDFRAGFFGRAIALFALTLGFGVVRGMLAGANFNYAFWESRFLISMVPAYFLATNTIRSRAHVRTLLTLIVVSAGYYAIDGVWRRYVIVPTGEIGTSQENWFSHECVIFWGVLVMLAFAQQVFGAPRWQRVVTPVLALVAVLAMLASERRAGLIAVVIAFAVFLLALININRKAFLLIAVPTVLIGAVYLPLFWNNPGTLGQLARAVRSLSSSADTRDAASNAWRDLEALNVRATIASDPVLGIGFGQPFLQIVTVPDISFFEFWNYESHHNILWVWMKTGALGFTSFFVVMLGCIARSIWLAKSLHERELKTFALVAMSALVMTAVYCYVDLGLTNERITLLLGFSLGTVGVLDRLGNVAHPRSHSTPATELSSRSLTRSFQSQR
jgi:hypothetical protein